MLVTARMAEASSSHQNLFTCSICSDLLKDAVTIPCGHNYCKGCVKGRWDQEDQTGVYSCPQCRLTFTSRPVLNKNNVLAALVEQFRKTRVSAASSTQCFAGPGDVECDSCTGRKLKAVKSCLVCLMSYCENHLQLHDELIIGKRHTVVDVTGHIQDKICSQHQRLLEVFCSTDQSCVCLLCLVDEHKGHDTVPAAAERAEKQKQMGETKKNFQERLNEREKKLQELRTDVETLKSSAQAAVKDSEGVFTEINRSIQRKHSEVTELIRAQEKAEVSRAKGLQMQLEQEIAELKRRDAELEQLSHTEDHIHFLKNFQSVSTLPKPKDESYFHISNSCSFEAVKKSVSTLKGQLDDVLKQKIRNTSAAVSDVPAVLAEPVTKDEFSKLSDVPAVLAEPVTKDEFSKYFSYFTLDPNTAHTCLHLSEGNRRVEWRDELQSYPDHPERFDRLGQVLCRECVSGRCYWEVEWSGKVSISVSYNTISRKGGVNECGFGANDQSWSLSSCFNLSPSFRHNNEETKLPLVASSRIGVYVDHRAGTLAFYSISDTMTLLHRVQTTFTQPLYPGFCVGSNLFFTSACSFCDQ